LPSAMVPAFVRSDRLEHPDKSITINNAALDTAKVRCFIKILLRKHVHLFTNEHA